VRLLQLAGYKKSGKTALAEALITRAASRGETCAVIKNIHGDLGLTGKDDGERFLQAGAQTAYLHRDGLTDTLSRTGGVMDLVRRSLGRCDILLIEGFKETAFPCIWCGSTDIPGEVKGPVLARFFMDSSQREPEKGEFCLYTLGEETLEALDLIVERLPAFPAGLDCGLCGTDCLGLYRRRLENTEARCPVQEGEKALTLSVNGKEVSLMPFVQSLLRETVKGFIKELKGYEEGSAEIIIHHQTKEEKL